MHFRNRLTGVAVAALLLTSLAGCGGDDPVADPTPIIGSSSTTPTTAASSAEPAPQAWEVKSKKGAIAFVKRWYEVWSEALVTGDDTEVRALSDAKCITCNAFIKELMRVYRSGGHVESEPWRVIKPLAHDVEGVNDKRVVARIVAPPSKVYEGHAKTPVAYDRVVENYQMTLRWKSDRWIMFEVEDIG